MKTVTNEDNKCHSYRFTEESKKAAGSSPAAFFIAFILLGCRNFRACVLAHITTEVFDRVDQDLDDVFRIVNK